MHDLYAGHYVLPGASHVLLMSNTSILQLELPSSGRAYDVDTTHEYGYRLPAHLASAAQTARAAPLITWAIPWSDVLSVEVHLGGRGSGAVRIHRVGGRSPAAAG